MRYLVGFGTYTASDDAIGVRVIEHVAKHGLDRGFRAIDLSSNSLNLVSYLEPATDAILIVDSARMGLSPGEMRLFAPDQVETRKVTGGLSTHGGDVLKVVELARATGYPIPRILIMGIEPATLAPGIGLSPALEARIPAYAEAAVEVLGTL
jgi:hydrogenase maturation protease